MSARAWEVTYIVRDPLDMGRQRVATLTDRVHVASAETPLGAVADAAVSLAQAGLSMGHGEEIIFQVRKA